MAETSWIHEFLREVHVPYSVVPHAPAFTARAEAAAVRVPGRDWARVVVCIVDGDPIQAVVPASRAVDFERSWTSSVGWTFDSPTNVNWSACTPTQS